MENVWSLFFNWMAENPIRATVIISAVVIALCILLGFVLPARSARRKREKEQRWRDARTVKTLGFIRSAKHTGRSVNDNPEFRFVVDALAEDGTFFETTVTEIIPRAQLPMCAAGAPLSIRYDPADRSHAIGDDNPDADVLNERIARYQCRRHPDELTYEQRMEFNRNSVVKKSAAGEFAADRERGGRGLGSGSDGSGHGQCGGRHGHEPYLLLKRQDA